MKPKFLLLTLLALTSLSAKSQDLDINKLDHYFNALEERGEAMGSITISRNGHILYDKAIGYRSVDDDARVAADNKTNYRIWSITKMYTATMIMQLVEEGELSLQTTLDDFYPDLPNANIITIQDMLKHKSGIHDFVQNDTSEDWDTYIEEPLTHAFMVDHIAQYPPDFQPGEEFRYSNSNYLLLGYIIEAIDGNLYETSLSNRIASKIGLTSTYFGVGVLDGVDNKAFSYQFDQRWKPVDEGDFSGLIPAGAGGIVSTPADMIRFIEALFAGKLIAQTSLNQMLPAQEFYGLGIMQMPFRDVQGFGHTGGYIASESSLVYYPQDSLTIAYATNGIVIRKEDILDNVLKIYHGEPFAVSMNRAWQAFLIFGLGFLLFLTAHFKFKTYANAKNMLRAGWVIAALFWIGQFIAGFMYGDYSHIRDGVTILDSFYSNSGTFMAGVQLLITMLSLPFIWALYKSCKRLGINFLPILPAGFVFMSMFGSSLFPFPNELYSLFANVIILTALGPLAVVVLWRREQESTIRWLSAFSLFLIVLSMGLIFSRSSMPEFVHTYWGVIQRLLFLGWTSWLAFLSLYFITSLKAEKSAPDLKAS